MKLILKAQARKPKAQGEPDAELLIYGDIGERWIGQFVDASTVNDQLRELNASHLLVRVNSYGGSVTDGTAIYNMIRALGIPVTVRIEGIAASIASLIAMAGDTVQAYANTMVMNHLPWLVAAGNAVELREMADVLDSFGEAMATSYARKTGRTAEAELEVLSDGKDHWYSAGRAKEEGYVDEVLDELEPVDDAEASERFAPSIAAMHRYRSAPAAMAAALHPRVAREVRATAGAPAPAATPSTPAASAAKPEECIMNWKTIAKALGLEVAADADDKTVRDQVRQHLQLEAAAADDAIMAAALKRQSGGDGGEGAGGAAAGPHKPEPTRAERVASMFAIARQARPEDKKLADLEAQAAIDEDKDLKDVRTELLAHMSNTAEPIGGSYAAIEAGADERDKRVDAAGDWLVFRAGVTSHDTDESKRVRKAMDGNPYRGHSYADLARSVLEANGINCRGMGRIALIDAAIKAAATHSTDDFPNIFENALHKTLRLGAQSVQPTWRRFCAVGSLSDFREHPRYTTGTFSDLQEVNENGEYVEGTMSDAERESIRGSSKGRVLNIGRDILINDDMGVFSNATFRLGQASERTVEKDVYAKLAENGGNGPTLGDGNPMFHASHNNIASNPAAPSVEAVEAMRVLMAQQKDVSGNDFLDIRPDVWLGPIGLGGTARVVNNSEYDPDANNKLQRVNKVRGLFSDVVDTPRLSGTAWYMLAAAVIEPVIEVAFLDGVEEAQLTMEDDFGTAGMKWRVIRDYGVAGVGYRGIVKNAGA
jgi:ATP-dependent protease ClpP protease subunit